VKLLVVESPNKVPTIKRYLGGDYDVAATVGHFRDLPRRDLGVDLQTFAPTYVVDDEKKSIVARLRSKAQAASEILLATDADREGEAISWHVAQVLHLRSPRRVRFQEITAKALERAIASAGPLDQHLVDAQQARRVLDRLVGYQVSPLLTVLGKGHSAGRVQSATLHLVVVRERERERFKAVPYWTLAARYGEGFEAKYATLNEKGELVEERLASEEEAQAIASRARGPHVVRSIDTKPVERRPKPPFTTSTLQQAASVQLGCSPQRTMALAQVLFEQGIITYHRTDSVNLSDEAIAMARTFIATDYADALPAEPPRYKSKSSAQEAHEAIRPTSLAPNAASTAEPDARELYELIRRRFLACQCKPAVLSQTTVAIESGNTTWRARGSVVQFPGFLHYLADDEDSEGKKKGPAEPKLPLLTIGQMLALARIDVRRQETKPPPRFTAASLIKEMERTGIGRPSTYAATIEILFRREYIAEEKKYLFPTERGFLVDEMLAKAFPDLLETAYTAAMETRLDEIAEGSRRWQAEIAEWYEPFKAQLLAAPTVFGQHLQGHPELAPNLPAAPKPAGRACPRCGKELLLRPRKKGGEFLSCSGYPGCEYAADPSAKASARACPKCQGPMEEVAGKFGAYARCLKGECGGTIDLAPSVAEPCPLCASPMRDKGSFLSCSRYPACTGSYDKSALTKAKKSGKKCPSCGGLLVQKTSPRGSFLGCAAYPKCRYVDPAQKARPRP
jgi:DNA topoisomerase I